MRDPFPFKCGTLSEALKDFFIDQRELESKPQTYEPILDILAHEKHEPYANKDEEGDAHEAFYDIMEKLLEEESEIFNKKLKAE